MYLAIAEASLSFNLRYDFQFLKIDFNPLFNSSGDWIKWAPRSTIALCSNSVTRKTQVQPNIRCSPRTDPTIDIISRNKQIFSQKV